MHITHFCRNAGSRCKQDDDHCDKESNVQGKSKRLALDRLGAQLLCYRILFAQILQTTFMAKSFEDYGVAEEFEYETYFAGRG